ncbi:hypothetical protein [Natrarchaeobius oligotrophus]|uniref:Uncharacterized protein n=1 Tax=Natrarchaeobius chitinivorans TaxID=1679083 RepID=A0A3N6NL97_NATCH|nr:hypothetical protein [Natrarchaeobius chitinivorans]RQH00103.1 hypothetical protein EA472_12920 [Natrarchaeobius chitinivorans]
MNANQQQLPPAQCELFVTNDAAHCSIQYGAGLDQVVNAAHNEIKWAMDRDDCKLEVIDVHNIDPTA